MLDTKIIIGIVIGLVVIVAIAAVFLQNSTTVNNPKQATSINNPGMTNMPANQYQNMPSMSLPTTDVEGEDPLRIRFPGTVRVSYTKENYGCTKSATYYVKGNKYNEVKEFYKNQLTSKGFDMESTNEIGANAIPIGGYGVIMEATVYTVTYTKNNGEEEYEVNIIKGKLNGEDITGIEVTWNNTIAEKCE